MSKVKLIDITPSSINKDKRIKALADAFDGSIEKQIKLDVLQVLTNVESLTGDVLDHVACQLHVDDYDTSNADEVKRKAILTSIQVHRYKGTPWAVEQAVSSLFSTASVTEWFQYGGDPYHFKVSFITEALLNRSQITRLVNLINQSKNTRSWLDGIEFYNETDVAIYYAAWVELEETIVIESDISEKEIFTLTEYTGAVVEDWGPVEISVILH